MCAGRGGGDVCVADMIWRTEDDVMSLLRIDLCQDAVLMRERKK